MANNRYVILDRDGVINEDSDDFIATPEQWQPLPGSMEAIALLNQHGFQVVVVTNQSGVARGLFDENTLAQIHAKMLDCVRAKGGKIAAIYYCPHGPDSRCACRKPKPGLINQCAKDLQINLPETYLVGDSLRDLQAAQAAGAMPVLVKTGKGQMTLVNNPDLNIPIFENLYGAAEFILTTQ